MDIKELLKIKRMTTDVSFINGFLLGLKIKKLDNNDLLSIHDDNNLLEIFCEHVDHKDFKDILNKIESKDLSSYIENNFNRIENLFSNMAKNNKPIDNMSSFLKKGYKKYEIPTGNFNFLYDILLKDKVEGERLLDCFTLSDKQKTDLLSLVIKNFNADIFEMLLKKDFYVYVKDDVISKDYPYINNTESLNENNNVFKVWESLTPEIIKQKSEDITKIFKLLTTDLTQDRYFYSLFSESMERTNSKYRSGSRIVVSENLPLEVWKIIYNNLHENDSKNITSNLLTKIDSEYTKDFIKNQYYLIGNGASRNYLFYLMSGIYLKSNIESIIKENENQDDYFIRNKVKEYVDSFKEIANDYFFIQDCGYLYYANENKFNINLCRPNSVIQHQPLLCNSLSMGVYLNDDKLIQKGIKFLKRNKENIPEQFIAILSFVSEESAFEKIKDFILPDIEEGDSPLYFKNGYLTFFENSLFESPKDYRYFFQMVSNGILFKRNPEILNYINFPSLITDPEEMYNIKSGFEEYFKNKKSNQNTELMNEKINGYIINYEKKLIENELNNNSETTKKLSKKRL